MPSVDVTLASLTRDQRDALWRLRVRPLGDFVGADTVPRGTAGALERRGLLERVDGSSRVLLTAEGRLAADELYRRRYLATPPSEGHVRLTAIVYARADTVYAPGCFDGDLGESITLRKDLGGSYTGRLVWYEVIEDGHAIRVTLDVPDALTKRAATPWSP